MVHPRYLPGTSKAPERPIRVSDSPPLGPADPDPSTPAAPSAGRPRTVDPEAFDAALAEIAALRARVTSLERARGDEVSRAQWPRTHARGGDDAADSAWTAFGDVASHVAAESRGRAPLLSGTGGFAILGGILVLIGAIFLVTLAINNGWISPGVQVTLAIVGGVLLTLASAWLRRASDPWRSPLTAAMAGTGGGVAFLGIVAGSRLYTEPVLSSAAGLALATAVAALIVVLAIRWNEQLLAAFGLVAAVSAPLVVGAPANAGTMAFVAVALCGVAVVVAVRGWPWTVHAGLWPSFVEAADYLDNAHHGLWYAVVAGGWWLLVAAGPIAFEIRARSNGLRMATVISMVTIGAASSVLGGIAVHESRAATGWYMVGLGAAYGALALGARIAGLPRITSIWAGIAGAILGGAGLTFVLGAGRPIEIGALWCAEGLAIGWLGDREGDDSIRIVAVGALVIGLSVLLVQAPPAALLFGASSLATFAVAGVFMTATCAVIAAVHRPFVFAAAAVALYTVSGIVVTAIGGERTSAAPDHISQAAQVTLSLVWVVAGVVVLGAALIRRSALLRRCGMGILALAAAKALIVDLSALTSVARVLALVGVGLLLFVASYLLARFERRNAGDAVPASPKS